ncbi:MAG: hypothetical protein VX278_00205, partial [Myxococcota bacterium]|nr:hypothetical protein [Myxococcota bacterium]
LGFVVNDEAREELRAFAMVEGIEVGDRVVVRNLVSGETEEGYISERGWFRVGVASDAIEPIERRPMLGMDDDDVDPEVPDDNRDFADALEIEIFRGEESIALVNTFQEELSFQGTTYVVDSPLVALQQGLGHARNTPDFARFLAIAQSAISPADPAIWGAHTFL